MTNDEWKAKNNYSRNYAHFDARVNLSYVWKYISDARNIETHGFYPFISYAMIFNKYNKKEGVKEKERKIMYSAHIDRYIYSYYGYLLNQKYNDFVNKNDINDSVIAYRDTLHKNNIHFARKAFDSIKEFENSYVVVGDFTKFFDKIDHSHLKRMMCKLLDVTRLPGDYYSVYKNITRYSEWPLKNLLLHHDLKDDENGRKELNGNNQVLTTTEFKSQKKDNLIRNKEAYGIPQGSAISAVLSNVYMMEFDVEVKNVVDEYNGIYMRYSDDFIIIIPNKAASIYDFYSKFIEIFRGTPGLELQPDKTTLVECSNEIISGDTPNEFLRGERKVNELDYLGFSFDGKYVRFRDKTVSKYYYRMYRKIKTINKNGGYSKKGNRISKKNLYDRYSIKGAFQGKGNFLTYVKRAEEIFYDEVRIKNVSLRHMNKINKRLKGK